MTSNLGRAIIRDRFKNKGRSAEHWVSPAEAAQHEVRDDALKSVTAPSDLDEFLATATLAGTEFEAERFNLKLITPNPKAGVLSHNEQIAIRDLHFQYKELLRIPRRPKWDTTTTHEELDEKERKGFLEWRRQLAESSEIESLILTPFEKNLEVWKQLWRVLERSDIVVQIVDARNPLLYACEDLSKYVKELSPNKDNLLLVNKADLLSESQRDAWASYFNGVNWKAVFFSAVEAAKSEDEAQSSAEGLLENTGANKSSDDDTNSEDSSSDSESHHAVDHMDASVEQDSIVISGDPQTNHDCSVVGPDNLSVQIPPSDTVLPGVSSSSFCTNRIFSRAELIQFLKLFHGDKPRVKDNIVTAGFVGYPNVGKSSTLNALMEDKRVSVSATPGKTKHFQTMFLDSELMLCDSPGLVMPSFAMSKAEMVVGGILPIDQIRDYIPPINLICSRIPRHMLESSYGILLPFMKEYGIDYVVIPPPTAEELLNAYGTMRGFVTARGLPDISRSARHILKDYVNGELRYCHAPPSVDQDEFLCQPEPLECSANDDVTVPKTNHAVPQPVSKSQRIDREFFASMRPGVHGRKNGRTEEQGPSTSSDAGGIGTKRHFKKNKKEKLRRVYRDLDVH